MSNTKKLKFAVVGGGISGLSAAFYLREKCPDAQITVFDKRNRLGGVLHTELRDGFEIEQSADNFITTVPYGLDLCRRLKLGNDIVTTTPRHRQTFILWKNRLHKLPDGFMMMAPTKWWPMAVTPLLSPLGKVRAALEFFIPGRKNDEDESMENFAVRRLGREVFDRLIEPLVSGVYAADMKKLSLLATLPRFREMEKKYGSLIWAMRQNRKIAQKEAAATQKEETQSGPRYNMFVTIRGGLSRIIDAIQSKLDSNEIHCGTCVTSMKPLPNGCWNLSWRKDGESAESADAAQSADFDAVILAAESYNTAQILESAEIHRAAELFGGIEHTGTVILTAAFRREDVGHALDGMGACVPAVEHNPILALSFSSEKYPHRAPEGFVLIRVFSGGARNPEVAKLSEEEIRTQLLAKMKPCLRIQADPVLTSVSRWPNTMPQLHLGHLERIAEFEKELSRYPTLAVAGNALTGVGIPQCVHTGEEAAKKVLKSVTETFES